MKKTILNGDEARMVIKSGIDKTATPIIKTLGPHGRNSIIGRPYQTPLITNDGDTIAKNIELDNEIEELGSQLVKQASKQSNDKAGDGTTTTTVLLKQLTDDLYGLMNTDSIIGNDINVMDVRNQIETSLKTVIEKLDEKKKLVTSLDELINIATISVENKELGKKIATMFWELGVDGAVKVEQSFNNSIDFSIENGAEINAGFAGPYMTNKEDDTGIYEKPSILVTNHKITTDEQVGIYVKALSSVGVKTLVIICDAIEKEVLVSISRTNMSQDKFKIVVIKVPQFNQIDYLNDIAILLGCSVLDKYAGTKFEYSEKYIGSCDKLEIEKDRTLIIGVTTDIGNTIDTIKNNIKSAKSLFDKEILQKRISFLNAKIGIISVGADSETDKEYLKLKIDDAVYATRVAMEDGYVMGGGKTLMEIANELPDNILTHTLKAPYNQIMKNAGKTFEIPDTVIDPVKVTKNAITNACSVGKLFISIDSAIADTPDKKKDISLDD